MTKKLWKTTIVVWSDYDPCDSRIEDHDPATHLVRESIDGSTALMTSFDSEEVTDSDKFPDSDFFE